MTSIRTPSCICRTLGFDVARLLVAVLAAPFYGRTGPIASDQPNRVKGLYSAGGDCNDHDNEQRPGIPIVQPGRERIDARHAKRDARRAGVRRQDGREKVRQQKRIRADRHIEKIRAAIGRQPEALTRLSRKLPHRQNGDNAVGRQEDRGRDRPEDPHFGARLCDGATARLPH